MHEDKRGLTRSMVCVRFRSGPQHHRLRCTGFSTLSLLSLAAPRRFVHKDITLNYTRGGKLCCSRQEVPRTLRVKRRVDNKYRIKKRNEKNGKSNISYVSIDKIEVILFLKVVDHVFQLPNRVFISPFPQRCIFYQNSVYFYFVVHPRPPAPYNQPVSVCDGRDVSLEIPGEFTVQVELITLDRCRDLEWNTL